MPNFMSSGLRRSIQPRSIGPHRPESNSLHPAKIGRPLRVERLDALAEILRRAQATIAMAFQFDRDREGGILGIVKKLLGGALGKRREAAQFVDEGHRRRLE